MKKLKYMIQLSIAVLFFSCSENNKIIEENQNRIISLASKINDDFQLIREDVKEIAEFTKHLYENSNDYVNLEDPSLYKLAETGVFYKPIDDGRSAVFVSSVKELTEKVKGIVLFTAPLDSVFKEIIKKRDAVVQVYYNDENNYNRIYPFIDVIGQYGAKLNIPEYNFYYLADEKHNPEKKAVWVNDPYVDPAGRGWMVSAIAPVYFNERLVGVPGIDVTINTIIDKYLSDQDILIIDQYGVLVAAEEKTVNLLSLPPLKDHKYIETIKGDKFLKDDYNLLKSKNNDVREMADKIINKNINQQEIKLLGNSYIIISAPISELNWKLIKIIKK